MVYNSLNMRKYLYCAGVCQFLLVFLACSSTGPSLKVDLNYAPAKPDIVKDIPPEPMGGMSALDYFKAEKITAGWNLGNTLDSYSFDEGGETYWGNPRVNQDLMNGLKAAGFDIIRIPVTWMGNIGDAPDYHIAESRLKRVSEVAEMAHKAGLKAVINLHHDGSTDRTKEIGWLSINKARRSREGYVEVASQFVRVWKQIALYFQNYGDWLMFESFNEIHDGNWGQSDFGFLLPQLQILNEWNQYFTDVVRSTGGNNAVRYLVIPGYCTTVKWTLDNFFKLPEDSSPHKQIVTFHYYDPYQFGIEGSRSSWGTDADKQQVVKDFAPFKEKYIDNNIAVIVGESGAVLQLYPDDKEREDRARESRREYLSYVYRTAKEYDLVPLYWDNGSVAGNGEKFGLFDRRTGQPISNESSVMINAMINAVK